MGPVLKVSTATTQRTASGKNAVNAASERVAPSFSVSLPVRTDAKSWCPERRVTGVRAPNRRRRLIRILIPIGALVVFSSLFVGADLLERYFADALPMGVRHALLTGIATIIAGVVSAVVYHLMRRQQKQLALTATQLTELLEAYQENPESAGHFENPHLVHCREQLGCERSECAMHGSPGKRCWQKLALRPPGTNHDHPLLSIKSCQECDVYRLSCPDEFYQLGEGINNLLYLLEQGAGQIGRMRDEMIEREKMASAGRMAAGVAHEVFNPLSSISAVVQMLRRHHQMTAHSAQLELIETDIQRISRIVRQMTDLTGPATQPWERVDLGKTLDDVIAYISYSPQARGIRIVYDREQNLPRTFGQSADLYQMVLHLVLNALDAMPDGGTLTLSAEAQDGRLVLTVKDTGFGIPDDVGRRVFEPFYTSKEPGRGTGLGLTVTYGIVQQHRGSIEFDSSPSLGTTFTVNLPILHTAPDTHHG